MSTIWSARTTEPTEPRAGSMPAMPEMSHTASDRLKRGSKPRAVTAALDWRGPMPVHTTRARSRSE